MRVNPEDAFEMTARDREPAARAILERTRSAVLNVLVAVGVGIAASGLILRWRDSFALFRATDSIRQAMLAGLFVLVVVSYLCRRVLGRRSLLRIPEHRAARFYRSHLISAAVGALAIPLGLAYGWTVQPRVESVAPFWVAALALGVLAIPRASELDGLDDPPAGTSEPTG
jgi:hypothetical protein